MPIVKISLLDSWTRQDDERQLEFPPDDNWNSRFTAGGLLVKIAPKEAILDGD